MKRVLALVGVLAVGLLLLFEPDTGALVVLEQASEPAPASTTSTAAPPDPTSDDVATTTTETWVPETTTTVPSPTTTSASTGDAESIVGEAVDSRFGYFQVEITVEDGTIVDMATLDEPGDRRSMRINETAIPIYTQQALELQSADFDAISGATVTWESWGASLASAIETAGLSQ